VLVEDADGVARDLRLAAPGAHGCHSKHLPHWATPHRQISSPVTDPEPFSTCMHQVALGPSTPQRHSAPWSDSTFKAVAQVALCKSRDVMV
jgi:hypothetical protein